MKRASASVIAMNFTSTSQAPVTLLELGLVAGSGRAVVCCPEGYWRRDNVESMCRRHGVPASPLLRSVPRSTVGVMAELKTKKNDSSVRDFIGAIEDAEKQKDARTLLRLMERVTGDKPKMWGASIVGFGEFHYRYASGREGDWLAIGFSPRAQGLTLYVMAGFERLRPLLEKLGPHSTSKSCLSVRRLAGLDPAILERIVRQAVVEAKGLDRGARASSAASNARTTTKTKKTATKTKTGARTSASAR